MFAGNWQSTKHVTYTNPFLAGSEMYLDVKVAADGSFRGTWGHYFCFSSVGAYGVQIISCSLQASGKQVSGRIESGRKGTIDAEGLGRSSFTWTSASPNELAIELPKNWQSRDEAILYKSRLTRDGKPVQKGPESARESGPPSSAMLLYREFDKDRAAALRRYEGKRVALEGRRGNLVEMSDGGAAIHVADGSRARALVLVFRDRRQVAGIQEGATFRFQCTVKNFDYGYVYMDDCSIQR